MQDMTATAPRQPAPTQPSPALTKLRGLAVAFRLTTRIWFDTLTPLAFIALVAEGASAPGTWVLIGSVLIAALFHAAGDYLNDANDVEVDAASSEAARNQRPSVRGEITRKDLIVSSIVLIGLSFAIVFTLPNWPEMLLCLAALTFLNWAYNLPPILLSNRGIVLEFYWPTIWLLMFAMCAFVLEAPQDAWQAALPYALFVAIFMGVGEGITQDIRDADNDEAGGRRTTPVIYGVPKAVIAAWTVQLLSIGIWLWFCIDFGIPTAAIVAGTAVLAAWQIYFGRLASILVKRFDKEAAKQTHVGPILVLTALNIIVLIAIA